MNLAERFAETARRLLDKPAVFDDAGTHTYGAILAAEEDEETLAILRRHGRTGRPWADPRFLARLEKQLSRRLAPGRPGRPRKGQ